MLQEASEDASEERLAMITNDDLAAIAKDLRGVVNECGMAADRAEEAAERIERIIKANPETPKDALELRGMGKTG